MKKNAIFLVLILPIIFSVTLKEPSVNAQSASKQEVKITTPEIEKSKIINAETDIKTEKNAISGLVIDKAFDKITAQNSFYKKKNNYLQKENDLLKRKLANSQKTLQYLTIISKNQKEENDNLIENNNDYDFGDSIICKIDTVYLQKEDHRNLFNRIINKQKK